MPHAKAGSPHRQRTDGVGKDTCCGQSRQGHQPCDETVEGIVKRPLVEVGKRRGDRLEAVAALNPDGRHHQRPAGQEADGEDREHDGSRQNQRPDGSRECQAQIGPHQESEQSPRHGEHEDAKEDECDGVERRGPLSRAIPHRTGQSRCILANERERHVPGDGSAENRPHKHEPAEPSQRPDQLAHGGRRSKRHRRQPQHIPSRDWQVIDQAEQARHHPPTWHQQTSTGQPAGA